MIAVDNTILASTQTCDTQAALRHVLGLTAAEDSAPLVAGGAVHEALAAWFKSSGSPIVAMAKFEHAYRAWAEEHVLDADDRLSWPSTRRVMQQWFDVNVYGLFPLVVRPELVEVGFALPLDTRFTFVGRMDAIGYDSRNAWSVVEHKSSGNLDVRWHRRLTRSAQVTGYTWAAQHHLQQPVVGALINGIELRRLPDSMRKCRDHGTPYAECGHRHAKFERFMTQRPPHLQLAWHAAALDTANKFARLLETVRTIDDVPTLPTNGQFTGACAECPFQLYCEQGRPTAARQVDALLRHEPWSPYEHAFQREPDA